MDHHQSHYQTNFIANMKDVSANLRPELIQILGNAERQPTSIYDGLPHRRNLLHHIIDAIEQAPSCEFDGKKGMPLACDFEWETDSVDRCDNKQQEEALKHHYSSELCRDSSFEEFKKDYCEDATIYEVIDDIPETYHGMDGLRSSMNELAAILQAQDGTPTIDLKHVKIYRNHAQVTWKAETPHHTYVFGTDAFTFDENNRIKSQSIVALSEVQGSHKPRQKK